MTYGIRYFLSSILTAVVTIIVDIAFMVILGLISYKFTNHYLYGATIGCFVSTFAAPAIYLFSDWEVDSKSTKISKPLGFFSFTCLMTLSSIVLSDNIRVAFEFTGVAAGIAIVITIVTATHNIITEKIY